MAIRYSPIRRVRGHRLTRKLVSLMFKHGPAKYRYMANLSHPKWIEGLLDCNLQQSMKSLEFSQSKLSPQMSIYGGATHPDMEYISRDPFFAGHFRYSLVTMQPISESGLKVNRDTTPAAMEPCRRPSPSQHQFVPTLNSRRPGEFFDLSMK